MNQFNAARWLQQFMNEIGWFVFVSWWGLWALQRHGLRQRERTKTRNQPMEWMNQQKESGMEASNAKRQFINLLMNGASVAGWNETPRRGKENLFSLASRMAFPQWTSKVKWMKGVVAFSFLIKWVMGSAPLPRTNSISSNTFDFIACCLLFFFLCPSEERGNQ